METLEKDVATLLKEEHNDWIAEIQKAETSGNGVDVNLGGNFANRMEKLLTHLRDFKARQAAKKKKGWFK